MFAVDLASPIPLDQLVLGSNATITLDGATLQYALLPGPAPVSSYTIISSATGGISGTFNGLPNNTVIPVGPLNLRINYSANAVTLTNVAIATPTVLHWTGAAGSNWSTAGNWAEDVAPTSGKSLVFDTTTVGFAGTAAAFAPNNDISGLTDITIGINDNSSAGDFVIGGNSIGLRVTPGTAITSTVTVTSGGGATINNPLSLNANTVFGVGLGTLTLGGIVSGGFSATQGSAPGATLALNGANTYSGGTTIATGTLLANNNTALGSGPLTLSGGTLSGATAFITLANPFTVTAPSAIGGGSFFTLSGSGVLNAGVTTTGGQSFSGALSGPGGFTIITFPGSTTFSGNQPNTFTGGVTVVFGGLNLQKPAGVTALASPISLIAPFTSLTLSADNQIADTVPVTANPGSQFSMNNHSDAILSLNALISTSDKATLSTGTVTPPTPPANLTLLGGSQSFAGSVTGNGSITYAGSGSFALYGPNSSYAGTMSVQGGTLAVSADFSAATVQLAGGTLGGTGVVRTITGTAGTVNPGGPSSGLLSTAAAAVTPSLGGLTLQVTLSTSVPSDQLVLGNTATLNLAGAGLSVSVINSTTGRVFTIITSSTGGISGTFNVLPENATLTAGGHTFRINYTADVVTLTDVPAASQRHWIGAVSSSWDAAGNGRKGRCRPAAARSSSTTRRRGSPVRPRRSPRTTTSPA
jgi:autotransporter-associated beta strand protein